MIIKKFFLRNEGCSQKQRFHKALDPLYAKIDDKSIREYLLLLKEYANEINFYDVDTYTIDKNWNIFFEYDPDELLKKMDSGNIQPHLALVITFLKLLSSAQTELNNLTEKHLCFYYEDILKYSKKPATEDKVHVCFELKKNIENQLMKKGALCNAGKDSAGNVLHYELLNDIIVNTSKISSLHSVYVDPKTNNIHEAVIANSSDGLGGELPVDEPKWSAFGHNKLPQSELGFSLASPILSLKEGTRTITVSFELGGFSYDSLLDTKAENAFIVYLTGENGWIGPFYTSPKVEDLALNMYSFDLILDNKQEAIIQYNSDIHGNTYETTYPLMQILLNNQSNYYNFIHLKNAVIKKIKIKVNVKDIETLELENDLGKIKVGKPFLPFGPFPESGANFTVGYKEAFTKYIKTFTLSIDWKGVPAAQFKNHYSDYEVSGLSTNKYFQAKLLASLGGTSAREYTVDLFNIDDAKSTHDITIPRKDTSFQMVFRAVNVLSGIFNLFVQSNRWAKTRLKNIQLTSKVLNVSSLKKNITQIKKSITLAESGKIILRLVHSFLHKKYREVYAKNVVSYANRNGGSLVLPNEPYTPMIQTIKLEYTAETAFVDLSSLEEKIYLENDIHFFQVSAFGQRREHCFQRNQLTYVTDKNTYLLAPFNNEGEFYIGISGLKPLLNVALFFQVAEGSADPELQKVSVMWSVLADNYWRNFEDTEILSDTTNGLLTSGIITFSIPKEATSSNTYMLNGYIWIRATIKKDIDAVCKLIDVKTNAVLLKFNDNSNDLTHLATALPKGKIKKLSEQLSSIKSVNQPYASFGGTLPETNKAFFTRVSERLRHKKRAITLWDYERLVLENFPSIYKVKCINHASLKFDNAPGNVTIVVIPNLINKNAIDPLKPKVDSNTLYEIKKFLENVCSCFVQFHITNPFYEQVMIDAKVRFLKGYEVNYYKKILKTDIKKILCPWAYQKEVDIQFGDILYKSVILSHLEKLDYVDYLSDFKMYHFIGENQDKKDHESITPSNSKAILVSTEDHNIESI